MIQNKSTNAWIAIVHGLGIDPRLAPYTLVLEGERSLHQAIADSVAGGKVDQHREKHCVRYRNEP
jgi:hypothetical protein